MNRKRLREESVNATKCLIFCCSDDKNAMQITAVKKERKKDERDRERNIQTKNKKERKRI